MARIVVDVMPKPEILDPQGKAIANELPRIGLDGFAGVRQGKRFELAAVVEERFFEVYNGHPLVNVLGDSLHAGNERIWDIVLTRRLSEGASAADGASEGGMLFGATNRGGQSHLTGELFKLMTGLPLQVDARVLVLYGDTPLLTRYCTTAIARAADGRTRRPAPPGPRGSCGSAAARGARAPSAGPRWTRSRPPARTGATG